MTQIRTLQNYQIQLRPDVHDAISASSDEYVLSRQALFKPQLFYGVDWVQTNCSSEERVLLMGWASLGSKWMAPILGMFVVTSSRFVFVRDNHTKCTDHPIQIYDRKGMSAIKEQRSSGGFHKLTFQYSGDGKTHEIDRIHADNMKKILHLLSF